MLWAQIVLMCYFGLVLMCAAFMHGKPKDGTHNFAADFVTILILLFLMFKAGGLSLVF